MLTPEERQRIEWEEQKRAEEDRYRAEVRSRFQPPPNVTPKSVEGRRAKQVAWTIAILAIFIVGITILGGLPIRSVRGSDESNGKSRSSDSGIRIPKTRYVPASRSIANGQITVKSGSAITHRIQIEPEMVDPVVVGNFSASGGSGNDIIGVIADEINYTNFINGHQAQVFWQTGGKQTVGTFEVRLRPGTYYLVLSNKFSTFTDKQVFLTADVKYKQAETYY